LPKVKLGPDDVRPAGRPLGAQHHDEPSKTPALLIRLKAVRARSGDRILPAIYSDNYIALMPGESRTILTEIEIADARREPPRMVIEGFNTD
jgi:hypothetical protein